MLKVSACIVVYNGYEEPLAAANSVLQHTKGVELDLYIVDNASPDGSGEALKKALAEGRLKTANNQRVFLKLSKENKGFGSGHNLVLDKLDSDFHFILNPDILLIEDTLSDMANYALNYSNLVMARPTLLFPDGKLQELPLRRCTAFALIYRQCPKIKFLKKYHDKYVMAGEDLSSPTEISFCTGSFTMIRTLIFRTIGGFDEGYFMYVEDADLTQKALKEGKVMLLPQFKAIHAWHRKPHKNKEHFMLQLKSMMRYFKKWGFRL